MTELEPKQAPKSEIYDQTRFQTAIDLLNGPDAAGSIRKYLETSADSGLVVDPLTQAVLTGATVALDPEHLAMTTDSNIVKALGLGEDTGSDRSKRVGQALLTLRGSTRDPEQAGELVGGLLNIISRSSNSPGNVDPLSRISEAFIGGVSIALTPNQQKRNVSDRVTKIVTAHK